MAMLKRLVHFFANIINHHQMINALAIKDYQGRFSGTLLGATWSVIHPLSITFVFWLVFSIGFRATGPVNIPFVLYFLAGYVPWTMFNESLSTSTGTVVAHSYLVKKAVFPSEILPLSQILTSIYNHLILLPITIGIILAHGYAPSLWMFQVFYYFICIIVFTLGLSWMCAALNVFYRDTSQVLLTILNFWFWMTPVVWHIGMVPERFRYLMHFNPMFYVIEGYRDSLIYQHAFWENPKAALIFWGTAITAVFLGSYVFRRLKPQFVDVL